MSATKEPGFGTVATFVIRTVTTVSSWNWSTKTKTLLDA
jgi:hypothetical protein